MGVFVAYSLYPQGGWVGTQCLPYLKTSGRDAVPTLPEATTPEPVGLLSDEVAFGGLAPESVDVEDVLPDTGDGYL